jgi:ribonucleoside-diphosphate reductase subunit M1
MKMRIPFDSEEAEKVNEHIFEAIYYGAVKSSIQLARRDGTYASYPGSPAS